MGWDSTPVSSDMAARMDCASVMFVGVRGSGETPPYGDTITSIRDALAQKWRGKGTVRQVYLNYPAADPHTLQNTPMSSLLFDSTMPSTEYFDSAALGAKKLIALLNTEKSSALRNGWFSLVFPRGHKPSRRPLLRPTPHSV